VLAPDADPRAGLGSSLGALRSLLRLRANRSLEGSEAEADRVQSCDRTTYRHRMHEEAHGSRGPWSSALLWDADGVLLLLTAVSGLLLLSSSFPDPSMRNQSFSRHPAWLDQPIYPRSNRAGVLIVGLIVFAIALEVTSQRA